MSDKSAALKEKLRQRALERKQNEAGGEEASSGDDRKAALKEKLRQ